jgi:hypothetical protein
LRFTLTSRSSRRAYLSGRERSKPAELTDESIS